jgi:hypothetical protein
VGHPVVLEKDLPPQLEGWAIALCVAEFCRSGWAAKVRRRGLKLAWSNEMMWHHPGELGLIAAAQLDLVLYTGQAQRRPLERGYARMLGMKNPPPVDESTAGTFISLIMVAGGSRGLSRGISSILRIFAGLIVGRIFGHW